MPPIGLYNAQKDPFAVAVARANELASSMVPQTEYEQVRFPRPWDPTPQDIQAQEYAKAAGVPILTPQQQQSPWAGIGDVFRSAINRHLERQSLEATTPQNQALPPLTTPSYAQMLERDRLKAEAEEERRRLLEESIAREEFAYNIESQRREREGRDRRYNVLVNSILPRILGQMDPSREQEIISAMRGIGMTDDEIQRARYTPRKGTQPKPTELDRYLDALRRTRAYRLAETEDQSRMEMEAIENFRRRGQKRDTRADDYAWSTYKAARSDDFDPMPHREAAAEAERARREARQFLGGPALMEGGAAEAGARGLASDMMRAPVPSMQTLPQTGPPPAPTEAGPFYGQTPEGTPLGGSGLIGREPATPSLRPQGGGNIEKAIANYRMMKQAGQDHMGQPISPDELREAFMQKYKVDPETALEGDVPDADMDQRVEAILKKWGAG